MFWHILFKFQITLHRLFLAKNTDFPQRTRPPLANRTPRPGLFPTHGHLQIASKFLYSDWLIPRKSILDTVATPVVQMQK